MGAKMSDEQVKITPKKEDKTKTLTFPISEGEDDELVLIAQYNPDQLARVIAEVYSKPYYIDRVGAQLPFENESEPLSEESLTERLLEECRRRNIDPPPGMLEQLSELFSEQAAEDANELNEAELYKPEVAKLLERLNTPEDRQLIQKAASAYILKKLHWRVWEFYGFFVAEVLDHS